MEIDIQYKSVSRGTCVGSHWNIITTVCTKPPSFSCAHYGRCACILLLVLGHRAEKGQKEKCADAHRSIVRVLCVRVLSFVIFSSFCFFERDEMKGAVESGFWISKCVCLTVHIAMARAGRRIIWWQEDEIRSAPLSAEPTHQVAFWTKFCKLGQ